MDSNFNPAIEDAPLSKPRNRFARPPNPPQPPGHAALHARFAWRGVAEAAVLIAVLLVLDRLFGDGHRFFGVEPHPFGLAVLLVAAQYGTAEAAATAILASAALLVLNLPEQSFDQDHVVWLQTVVREPLLWLSASLVIGEITGRTRQRAREGAVLALRRESELTAMVEANTELVSRVTTLETRIASQQRTVTSIYEAARGLGPDRDAVLVGALALVRAATGATSTSIYLLRDNLLVPAGSDGWDDANHATTFGTGDRFYEAIIGQRRCLRANDPNDRDALDRIGLLAGPILTPDGAVLGALIVVTIPFTQLHLGAVANFRSVCEWVGDGLDKAERFEAANQGRFLVEGSSLVASAHSDRLIGIMGATARRIGFDLTLMQIDIEHVAATGRDLVAVMETVLRDTDLLIEGEDSQRLRVLMPGTPLRNVPLVAERLRTAFAAQNPDLPAGLSISWLSLNQLDRAPTP